VPKEATSPNFAARLYGCQGPDCLLATTTEKGCSLKVSRNSKEWLIQYCHHEFQLTNDRSVHAQRPLNSIKKAQSGGLLTH